MMRTRLVLLLAILAMTGVAVLGQTNTSAAAAKLSPRVFAGETLKYEGRVSRLRMSVAVADLAFNVTQANSQGDILIRTTAVSKGTLLKLFRYSFSQSYESTVDDSFRVLRTTKHDVQKQRVRDGDAVFDYDQKRVTYVETDPKDPNRPPRRIASEIGPAIHDMASAIFYLRLQPLSVGRRFEITVSDSGLVYRVPVMVTGREMQKTVLGKVSCFKVEPEIFGTGRLIEQKGKMIIWLAEDSKQTPVRAQIDSQYGKIEIKLKSVTRQ
jgi:hypothetical protein